MPDKRLIDANVLLKRIAHHTVHDSLKRITFEAANTYEQVKGDMFNLVQKAPVVDAVEVVRCKDCKHAIVNQNHIEKPLICCKTKMVGTTDPDWFCAAGERKEGGAEV